jgi:hypothetical protein
MRALAHVYLRGTALADFWRMARIARPESQSLTRTRAQGESRQGQTGGGEQQQEGSPFTRLANEAISMVSKQLQKQVHRPAADLDRLARALRLTSEQLSGTLAVPVITRAAAEAERAARFLEQNDARQTLDAVERFARQKPLLFLGGALAVGVGAGRFLKSSAFEPGSGASQGTQSSRRTARASQGHGATTSQQTTQRGNDHEPQQAQQESSQSGRRAGAAQRAHGSADAQQRSASDAYRPGQSGAGRASRSQLAAERDDEAGVGSED